MYMPLRPYYEDDSVEHEQSDGLLSTEQLEYLDELEFLWDLVKIETYTPGQVRRSFIFHPSFIDAYWLLERKDPLMAKEYIERLMTHGTNNANDGPPPTCKYVEIALRWKFRIIDKAAARYGGYKIGTFYKGRRIWQAQKERDTKKVTTGFFCYEDYLQMGKDLLSPEQYREYLFALTEIGCDRKYQTDDTDIQLLLSHIIPAMNATDLRYRRSISNGRKGGRHRIFSDEELICAIKQKGLTTQKELASYFGCSVRTIARRQASTSYAKKYRNWEQG